MTASDQNVVLRHNSTAAIIYYVVYIFLLPVTPIGCVLWVGKLYVGRRAGVSATAQGPLSARWFQHQLGTRRDVPARRILMVLPGVSPLAVRLVFGPLLLAHRLRGYVPPVFHYPFEGGINLQNQASARRTVYDSVVERYLTIAQFVILGAGFDTRTLRLPREMRVRSFEVDAPKTLAIKREALKKADVDPAGVSFVAADFEQGDWLSQLVAAGFDADQPALFLWEGVTPYLGRPPSRTRCTKSPEPPEVASSPSTTSRPRCSRRSRCICEWCERRSERAANR